MPTLSQRRSSLVPLVAALLLAVLASACGEEGSASVPSRSRAVPGGGAGAGVSAGQEGRFALIALNAATERQAVSAAGAAREVEVAGQFVAYQGPDDRWALRVLDLWLPEPDANGGLDACRLQLDALDTDALALDPDELPDYRIELLDAGAISLARDERSDLQVHYLPDLQAYLSGLIYGLEPGEVAYHADAAYVFEGVGGHGAASFSVAIAAPPAMVLLAVDGQLYDAMVEMVLPSGRDLQLEWLAAPSPADEIVYLDLYDDARSATPLLSCAVADDGHFALPRAALEQVRANVPDAALRLVARRARAADFALEGFDWARAVFTTSDTVFLVP